MKCVIDASLAANLVLPDEPTLLSDEFADEMIDVGSAAPLILQIELVNILLVAVRRKRILPHEVSGFLQECDELSIQLQPALTESQRLQVVQLAQTHQLTAYDASYLELAMRLKLPLATSDKQLIKAATAEGVKLALQ